MAPEAIPACRRAGFFTDIRDPHMSISSDGLHPQFAAIVYEAGTDPDRALRQAIDTLCSCGITFGGIVHSDSPPAAAGRRVMLVEDIASGELLQISQDRGPEAQGCCLDTAALSAASRPVREAMARHVDVVVINRFGEQEANGRGLRAEFADAAISGFVVVTVTRPEFLTAWTDFSGDLGTVLEPDPDAIRDWIAGAVTHRPAFA